MKTVQTLNKEPERIALIAKALGQFMVELSGTLQTVENVHPMVTEIFIPQVLDSYFNFLLSIPTTDADLDEIKEAFINQKFTQALEALPVEGQKMH